MKKKCIKSLKLNKRSISNFHSSIIHGGSGACTIESVIICDSPITHTCTVSNAGCNQTANGCVGNSDDCHTRIQANCNVGTSNLASPC